MPTEETLIDVIFSAAIELPSPEERAAYVKRACGEDLELLHRVEALIVAHLRAEDFLESPASGLHVARHQPGPMRIEDTIGPYKLLQEIGEGGMGTVYMAEQFHPVQRKVALKIIKAGMDSCQVIARFEAERQALALMDHPNIAKMLDAGMTEIGKPYFVMELIKGIPITEYSDQHKLSTNERIKLFISVCSAVQHAHQKGIIHRDIKPTNILVAEYDDKPVVKVIDFGVAKALSQQLIERTMFTQFGQVLGTIEYMSPEQAKLNQLDIDTRTDVYSLGVLLYELLTGSTPFEKERMRSAAFDEMLRIIREEEPAKPSTRLSTSQALPSIAANRQLEPKKLTMLVRGDLDWIVMRSLEKDRVRRYQTAIGIAEDLQRYLSDQPVEAREPTRIYRLKKFIRRNKAGVVASSAIIVALMFGLTISTVLYVRTEAERQDVEQARAEEAAERHSAETNLASARGAIDHLTQIAQDRLVGLPDATDIRRDMLDDAARYLEGLRNENAHDVETTLQLAKAYERAGSLRTDLGQEDQAIELLHRAQNLIAPLVAAAPHDQRLLFEQAYAYFAIDVAANAMHDYAEAERNLREAARIWLALWQEKPADRNLKKWYTAAIASRGLKLKMLGQIDEALAELRLGLKLQQELAADAQANTDDQTKIAWSHQWVAACLAWLGRFEEAEQNYRQAIEIHRSILNQQPDSSSEKLELAHIQQYLGSCLVDAGRAAEALPILDESLQSSTEVARQTPQFPDPKWRIATTNVNFGYALERLERHAAARDAYKVAIGQLWELYRGNPRSPRFAIELARQLAICAEPDVRDPRQALTILRSAIERSPNLRELRLLQAAALYQDGDAEGALQALAEAQRIGPEDLKFAWYLKALAEKSAGQDAAAQRSFDRGEAWAASTPRRWEEPRVFIEEARRTMSLPAGRPSAEASAQ